jgi:hypothetical protein
LIGIFAIPKHELSEIEDPKFKLILKGGLLFRKYVLPVLLLAGLIYILILFFNRDADGTRSIVDRKTVESDVRKIKALNNLDTNEVRILNQIVNISKDREYFIGSLGEGIRNRVVDSIEFEKVTGDFFDFLFENKILYSDVLKEKREEQLIREKYEEQLKSYCSTIDSICNVAKLDMADIQKELNEEVKVRILEIETSEFDKIGEAVQIKAEFINMTNNPIEYLRAKVTFSKKYGERIDEVILNSGRSFSSRTVGYFYFKEGSKTYESLKNIVLENNSYTYQILKIMDKGGIFPPSDFDMLFFENHAVTSNCICIFLDDSTPAILKRNQLWEERNREIDEKLELVRRLKLTDENLLITFDEN